ncbi:MAG: sugar phosphate isomerase/epimerase [Verrucomicrobia bacterium]|nr:sugar phosphate isomerase/epimerase [Verrucomicrobiota bacterium]
MNGKTTGWPSTGFRVNSRERFKEMQLGIFAKTFARASVEETFAAVASLGLHCVQFNFACAGLPSLPDEIDPALLQRIRRAAAARGIAIAAVSATFNMIHPDAQQRGEGVRCLGVVAESCAILGAKTATLCTGTRDPENMWRWHPDNNSLAAWRDLLATLAEAVALAEKHGVSLGVEPETGNVINSARKARQLLDELKSPRLKIIMDAANLFHPGDLPRQREIIDEAFALLGGDIALAHAKQLGTDGHAGNLALGTGVLDWRHYLASLRRANFAGPLIMHGFEEAAAAASVDFLRRQLSNSN